jgi:uncharacterized protein (DUF2252 family)
MDVIREIQQFNAGRDPDRLRLKYGVMRSSAFVFLRSTCHLFYLRLPSLPLLRSAPPVWLCGDLHLQNFGSYKGDNGQVYFDLNDFDEAALGPASWDVLRFLTSVLVGAATMGVKRDGAQLLCDTFLDAYRGGLVSGKAGWVERETAHGLVKKLLDGLQGRLRPKLLASRTVEKEGRRVLRLDNGKALPASDKQRERITRVIAGVAAAQPDPRFYEVLDVARRIAGNGSLGVDRFAILVRGKGGPEGQCILDLKEALPSSLLATLKTRQPEWKSEAQRVVEVERRMQAHSMAFLQHLRIGKRSYVLRALQPSEDRVTLDQARSGEDALHGVMHTMGECVAGAQLRSSGRDGSAIADELIAFGQAKWRKALIAAAGQCAEQVQEDWVTYCRAFDDGQFKL